MRINYINLANVGRTLRIGPSTPGFDCDGIFVSLGDLATWAQGRFDYFPARVRTQDRRAMYLHEDPRVLAATLAQIRSGSGQNLALSLRRIENAH